MFFCCCGIIHIRNVCSCNKSAFGVFMLHLFAHVYTFFLHFFHQQSVLHSLFCDLCPRTWAHAHRHTMLTKWYVAITCSHLMRFHCIISSYVYFYRSHYVCVFALLHLKSYADDLRLQQRAHQIERKKMTGRSVVMGSHHQREKKTWSRRVLCVRDNCAREHVRSMLAIVHTWAVVSCIVAHCVFIRIQLIIIISARGLSLSVHHYNGCYNIYAVTVLIRYISIVIRAMAEDALPFFFLFLAIRSFIHFFIATITQSSLKLHPCVW